MVAIEAFLVDLRDCCCFAPLLALQRDGHLCNMTGMILRNSLKIGARVIQLKPLRLEMSTVNR